MVRGSRGSGRPWLFTDGEAKRGWDYECFYTQTVGTRLSFLIWLIIRDVKDQSAAPWPNEKRWSRLGTTEPKFAYQTKYRKLKQAIVREQKPAEGKMSRWSTWGWQEIKFFIKIWFNGIIYELLSTGEKNNNNKMVAIILGGNEAK